MKAAQQRSGRPTYFQDYLNKVQRALAQAKKDNDFIYHERVPDPKCLNPVGKALLAKPLPIPDKLSADFRGMLNTNISFIYFVYHNIIRWLFRKKKKKKENDIIFINNIPASFNSCTRLLFETLAVTFDGLFLFF